MAAQDVEVQRASASIFEITNEESGGWSFGASRLFKNIESYPGQLLSVPSILSAKAEQKIARKDAVKGARHVERTNAHVRGGIDRKVNMVVGAKLRVQSTPQAELLGLIAGWTPEFTKKWRKEFSRTCEIFFHDWAYSKRCVQDAERHLNFGGLMWLAYRGIVGPDAATCGFIGYDEERATRYNSRWATFVNLYDPDRIATPYDKAGQEVENKIFQGRALDEWGAMEGFYVTKGHPSDGGTEGVEFEYIPRETDWGRPFGFHWFMKYRPGAQHGLTTLITDLRTSTMLDKFDDARLGAAILQELFAFYVKSNADAGAVAASLAPGKDGTAPFDYKLGFYEKAKIRIGQQRVAVLPDGDDLGFITADREGGGGDAFVNQFLRKMAMSLDLPFEQFANDYSQANYSSIRASLLDAWRGVMAQRELFGQHLPALIFDAVIEEAIFKGWIVLPEGAPPFKMYRDAYTACTVTGPGMGWVDPYKEAMALEVLRRNKFTSHQRIAASNGEDHLEIFDEVSDEQAEAEERGISLEIVAAGPAAEVDDEDEDETAPEDRRPGRANEE